MVVWIVFKGLVQNCNMIVLIFKKTTLQIVSRNLWISYSLSCLLICSLFLFTWKVAGDLKLKFGLSFHFQNFQLS